MKNDEENEFLDALLNYLCPGDREEAGRRYVALHSKLEGFFRLKGMSDPGNDADETLIRAGKKIAKGKKIPDITNFCMGIAGNIVHERLREEKRKERASRRFWETNKDKSIEAAELDRITNLMQRCVSLLSEDDQNLLISYCTATPGVDLAEHRLQLAKSRNWSIGALRIRIMRLRHDLANCLERLRQTL